MPVDCRACSPAHVKSGKRYAPRAVAGGGLKLCFATLLEKSVIRTMYQQNKGLWALKPSMDEIKCHQTPHFFRNLCALWVFVRCLVPFWGGWTSCACTVTSRLLGTHAHVRRSQITQTSRAAHTTAMRRLAIFALHLM